MGRSSVEDLVRQAWRARERACAEFSGFAVGAALETEDGRVFTGCNVESTSYGLSCCAERVALFKALSEGFRSFARIAIVTGAPEPCPPCGACLQLLSDYAPGLRVVLANRRAARQLDLAELLPFGFGREYLDRR